MEIIIKSAVIAIIIFVVVSYVVQTTIDKLKRK